MPHADYNRSDEAHRWPADADPAEMWRAVRTAAYQAFGGPAWRVLENGTRIELTVRGEDFRKELRVVHAADVSAEPERLDRWLTQVQALVERLTEIPPRVIGAWKLVAVRTREPQDKDERARTEVVYLEEFPVRGQQQPESEPEPDSEQVELGIGASIE